ncbi:hypothetical protein AcW1_004674 [Taiwanofungus camphoratus]|nr:hypothetical protein AcW2_006321 [Antrodia cinnamomea]KAI0939756.1 hypothetical protein AcV5_001059 [Antrodia cinnamomea]KAI0952672.1 hypothetical protein AcV7_008388 [Antrodia cinnamomea]KAI0960043.1 hypothetical protein AcW1_004674 [Antrodia cinnamomea]
MEKFSAFRDPGTGIQPFLRPVPPTGSETLAKLVLPFRYLIGAVRTLLVVVLGLLYALIGGVCLVLRPVPILHRVVTHAFTALIVRLVLLILGLPWIPVEVVTRKRGRGAKATEVWNPGPGNIIVSNWASTIEILWLAVRFNPIFVLPIYSSADLPMASSHANFPVSRTPGLRTGTGSAAISQPSARTPTKRVFIRGFRQVSLLSILRATGRVPIADDASVSKAESLEQIRSQADRPVVVFPECTTSNGRGLLRFAELFRGVDMPVAKFKVFVMCARYDPPTALRPTMTHPIPAANANPLAHFFSLTTSLVPLTLSIRLLSPSESPSSGSFLSSEFITADKSKDPLSEACASLIAQIGKMKRVGLGWEDKVAFLEFYRGKK